MWKNEQVKCQSTIDVTMSKVLRGKDNHKETCCALSLPSLTFPRSTFSSFCFSPLVLILDLVHIDSSHHQKLTRQPPLLPPRIGQIVSRSAIALMLTTSGEASPGVASLASRIGGLSTDESQKQSPSSPAAKERPRPNTSNPLFGKALAGASRAAPPPKSEQSSSSGSPLKATAPSFKPSAAAPAFVPASPTKAKAEDKTESKSEEPSKPPPESTTKKEDTMDDGK